MITIENDCSGGLPSGFFSKFLVVLDWVHNSIYQKEKVYVDWSCKKSLDYNLWDIFFEQPNLDIDETGRELKLDHYRYQHRHLVYSNINSVLPMFTEEQAKLVNKIHLFFHPQFDLIRSEYNKAWNLIKVKDYILESIQDYEKKITPKTLGITVRIPLHYTFNYPEGPALSTRITPKEYYDVISNEVIKVFEEGGYENIFIACDIEHFIDLMISKLGDDKLVYTKYQRVKNLNGDWVEKKLPFKDEYELILKDTLLLSKCDYIMGGSSNIFTAALYINKNSKFKIFDILNNLYGC